ncbi:MAG: DoxX family protein [Bdellovibrio sp.]
MEKLILFLQTTVALGLLNVWLLRFNDSTPYRGAGSKNLREEFKVYGLATWVLYLIGVLKIGSALALIAGIWVPSLVAPAATIITFLMIGAIFMHIRVRDPLVKSLPATFMLVLGITISLLAA